MKAPFLAASMWLGYEGACLAFTLTPVATDLRQPTEVVFIPGSEHQAVVAEKSGRLMWIDLKAKTKGLVHQLAVRTRSEQGLLGIAFDPNFHTTRRVVLSYVIDKAGTGWTQIRSFRWRGDSIEKAKLTPLGLHYETIQPYGNHDGGQIQFGPDGNLYIALGDGGSAGDPLGHGQNPRTPLGSLLRISIPPDGGKGFMVPADNPFVSGKTGLPEIWAYGLRNPWKFCFDGAGRIILADVGQNETEEINLIEKGGNYGWNILEGNTCFLKPGCSKSQYTAPIYTLSRSEFASIVGGYVYQGPIESLRGKYIFGDFVTKRLAALDLKSLTVTELGRLEDAISTFAQDSRGLVYVAGFTKGKLYRIDP